MNWTESQANCMSMDAYLVEITSSEENLYIFDMSDNIGIDVRWIGLNDILVEGSFVWPSGERLVYHEFQHGIQHLIRWQTVGIQLAFCQLS